MITVRHENRPLEPVSCLDRQVFIESEIMSGEEIDRCDWWIARTKSNKAVGFGGARIVPGTGLVYLHRAGVIPSARGHKIQRRLISARVSWARRQGARAVITYTVVNNVASSNSLTGFGFVRYSPATKWVGDDVLYWWKELGK